MALASLASLPPRLSFDLSLVRQMIAMGHGVGASMASHFPKPSTTTIPPRVSTLVGDLSGTYCHPFAAIVSEAFVRVFEQEGVTLHWDEATKPMGMPKDLHMEALLDNPTIKERWTKTKGQEPNDKDRARLYDSFVPLQEDLLRNFSYPLPHVKTVLKTLQEDYKICVGATTGFPQHLASIVQESLATQGVKIEAVVGCDSVLHGSRPAPFMLYKCMDLLGGWPLSSVVKVGDTLGDVKEGREAGVWTVGVTNYSSMLGIYYFQDEGIDFLRLPIHPKTFMERQLEAKEQMLDAGAHYVIPSLVELPSVIDEMNFRMKNGESP